jgi:hypothetical protein
MPTNTSRCLKCQATLRLSTQVEPGKKLRCPKCRTVFAAPAAEEPQEVEDVPEAVRPAPPEPPNDEPEEERPRKPRRARSPKKPTAPPFVRLLSYGLLGVALLLALIGFALGGGLGGAIALLLFVLAFGCMVTGHIWIVVVAFQDQLTSGLLCLLVPLYGLFFARKHQARAGLGYNLFLVALVILFFGAGPLTSYLNMRAGPQPNGTSGPATAAKPAAWAIDPVLKALGDLKSNDVGRRLGAAIRLSQLKPDEHQAQVSQALEELLRDVDSSIRKAAVEALGVWGTKENVPPLLPLVADKDLMTRRAAIEVLGKLKDERAIEPIAKQLEDGFNRDKVSQALQGFGPAAEKAVLPSVPQGSGDPRGSVPHPQGNRYHGEPARLEAFCRQQERPQHGQACCRCHRRH